MVINVDYSLHNHTYIVGLTYKCQDPTSGVAASAVSPSSNMSPNSECLRGSNDVSVPGSNAPPFFPTCPGFGFYGPPNTFHAHARYLVMVSRRFYGKKHCFNAGSSAAITKSILIIDVFETSSHKTLQNKLFLITRGPPGRFFMRTRGTWWWWAVVSIVKSIVPQIAYAWGAPMMFLYPVQIRPHFPDLSRSPFLRSPEHVLCARAVLGDGQPLFLW